MLVLPINFISFITSLHSKMVSRVEKQKMLARKLQILKAIIRSNAEKKSDVLLDAANYITQLKQRLEEMTTECEELRTREDVKVERVENNTFNIKVRCETAQDLLPSIMEAFSGMGLHVLRANINTDHFFNMEAIAEVEDESFDADYMTRTIYMVVRNSWVANRN